MAPVVMAVKYLVIFLIGFFMGRIVLAVQYAVMSSKAKKGHQHTLTEGTKN